jgi:hypothetical protein
MFPPLSTGEPVAARRDVRALPCLLFAVVLTLIPMPARAVTADQIVALAHAGVTDAVILALIDRDKTIFAIDPEQLVALQAQGLSEPVILAMLKSGREEGERAAQAAADLNTAMILASIAPGPDLVVVGHGPEVPDVAHPNGFYSGPPSGGYLALPYVDSGYGGRRRGRYASPITTPYTAQFTSPFHEPAIPVQGPVIPPVALRRVEAPQPRALCLAAMSTATSTRPLSFVTECPAVMQPKRPR